MDEDILPEYSPSRVDEVVNEEEEAEIVAVAMAQPSFLKSKSYRSIYQDELHYCISF